MPAPGVPQYTSPARPVWSSLSNKLIRPSTIDGPGNDRRRSPNSASAAAVTTCAERWSLRFSGRAVPLWLGMRLARFTRRERPGKPRETRGAREQDVAGRVACGNGAGHGRCDRPASGVRRRATRNPSEHAAQHDAGAVVQSCPAAGWPRRTWDATNGRRRSATCPPSRKHTTSSHTWIFRVGNQTNAATRGELSAAIASGRSIVR